MMLSFFPEALLEEKENKAVMEMQEKSRQYRLKNGGLLVCVH